MRYKMVEPTKHGDKTLSMECPHCSLTICYMVKIPDECPHCGRGLI